MSDSSFRECAACSAKTGSPELCPACRHNRAHIDILERQVRAITHAHSATDNIRDELEKELKLLRADHDRLEVLEDENFCAFRLDNGFVTIGLANGVGGTGLTVREALDNAADCQNAYDAERSSQ